MNIQKQIIVGIGPSEEGTANILKHLVEVFGLQPLAADGDRQSSLDQVLKNPKKIAITSTDIEGAKAIKEKYGQKVGIILVAPHTERPMKTPDGLDEAMKIMDARIVNDDLEIAQRNARRIMRSFLLLPKPESVAAE